MTTEDDFQRALDASPDDHQTRLVFADWLQERGDPRAEGYRALGRLRVSPCHFGSGIFDADARAKMGAVPGAVYRDKWWWCASPDEKFRPHFLPDGWFSGARVPLFPTRREAEDAAALAFGELSPTRRAEVLTAAPGTRERQKAALKNPARRKVPNEPKGKQR